MKMFKSLLLGSAAGVVAVGGAQAADLPVKAKPVEYVKICSLYGDGFFYVPGTDICIRLGTNVQADMYWNALGNGHVQYDAAGGANDRSVNQMGGKSRGDFALDTRTQTQYGTLRSYLVYRMDNTDQGTLTPNLVRNFVQWAGFTFGHTKSYYDSISAYSDFKALFQGGMFTSDSGANGTNQIAYTWELGNGMVFVAGADERKNGALLNLSNSSPTSAPQITTSNQPGVSPFNNTVIIGPQVPGNGNVAGAGTTLALGAQGLNGTSAASVNTQAVPQLGTAGTSSRAGMQFWDPYLAFRVSQAWGGFTAAIHANYNSATANNYATTGVTGPSTAGAIFVNTNVAPTGTPACFQPGTAMCGNPNDKWGWAVNSGIEIKLPQIAQGDRIGASATYGVGAGRYTGANIAGVGLYGKSNLPGVAGSIATGIASDAVFINGGQLQLTTSWGAMAAFEHWWTPEISSMILGGVAGQQYNATVVNSRMFCGTGGVAGAGPISQGAGVAPAGTVGGANPIASTGTQQGYQVAGVCDPGFKLAQVGGQVDWFPIRGFHFGVGLLYTMVSTGFANQIITITKTQGLRPTGAYVTKDDNILAVAFRVQRNFGGLGE
jgi:Porin subfamily